VEFENIEHLCYVLKNVRVSSEIGQMAESVGVGGRQNVVSIFSAEALQKPPLRRRGRGGKVKQHPAAIGLGPVNTKKTQLHGSSILQRMMMMVLMIMLNSDDEGNNKMKNKKDIT
jgi:hypothetical protein